MSKSDFGRSFNTFRKRVEEKPISLTRLGRRRGCRGRLERGDEGGVLTLLRIYALNYIYIGYSR